MDRTSRETARSSVLHHAENTVLKLVQATEVAGQAYQDAVNEMQKTRDNFIRHENTLKEAQVAYRYFHLTLADGALDRGEDVLCCAQPNGETMYFSGMSLLF